MPVVLARLRDGGPGRFLTAASLAPEFAGRHPAHAAKGTRKMSRVCVTGSKSDVDEFDIAIAEESCGILEAGECEQL